MYEAAMEVIAGKSSSLLKTGTEKTKSTKKKTGKKQSPDKEKADGDKPRKTKKLVGKKTLPVASRYLQYQHNNTFVDNLRKSRASTHRYASRVYHPFITGSGQSHNIGIKLQQMEKRKEDPLLPPLKVTKRAKSIFTPVKRQYKGWIESPEPPDWTKKVKEMFVVLHNEYSSLLEIQAELKKIKESEEKSNKLAEISKKLENKELQIHVALKIYDENQKLRDEVIWLRKNIRPGRAKVRKLSHQKKSGISPQV